MVGMALQGSAGAQKGHSSSNPNSSREGFCEFDLVHWNLPGHVASPYVCFFIIIAPVCAATVNELLYFGKLYEGEWQ